jgi:hypothetical protein
MEATAVWSIEHESCVPVYRYRTVPVYRYRTVYRYKRKASGVRRQVPGSRFRRTVDYTVATVEQQAQRERRHAPLIVRTRHTHQKRSFKRS